MKIVSFRDGLGNQLFQYRLFQYLRKKYPTESIYGFYNKKWLQAHNGLELFEVFDIERPKNSFLSTIIANFLRVIDKFFPIISRDLHFNADSIMFMGYWQNKYVWGESFDPIPFRKFTLSNNNIEVLKLIHESQAVSVHVRRGDYLLPENSIYNICDLDYYKKCFEIIRREVNSPHFFVFSDDIEWAKLNLILYDVTYIYWNKDKDSYIDMYLMSQCQYSIIANSSFSYWGAVNGVPKKIVLYPHNWRLKMTGEKPNIFKSDWYAI